MNEFRIDHRTLGTRSRMNQGKAMFSLKMTPAVRRMTETMAIRLNMSLRGIVETAITRMANQELSEADVAECLESTAKTAEQGGHAL